MDKCKLAAPADPLPAGGGNYWHWEVSFTAPFLRRTDPIEVLLGAVFSIPEIATQRQMVYLIISELLNNAIDHGLLGLDSAVKQQDQGFDQYYEERNARLSRLESGFVRCVLACEWASAGGRLCVEVEDSGPGYTNAERLSGEQKHSGQENQVPDASSNSATVPEIAFSGLGLALLRAVCSEIQVSPRGNCIAVVYEWRL